MNWTNLIRSVDRHAKNDIVAAIANKADAVLPKWGFTTTNRKAHLFGHMSVETAGFTTWEENLNYSAARLLQIFPSHFDEAAATRCAHDPVAIANAAYGGRMGNRPGTDDGWVHRGKGLLDCTGRDNDELLGRHLGVDPETAAAWLIDPEHALECACALFTALAGFRFADLGETAPAIVAETRRINGGLNGLARREVMIAAYHHALLTTD